MYMRISKALELLDIPKSKYHTVWRLCRDMKIAHKRVIVCGKISYYVTLEEIGKYFKVQEVKGRGGH